MNIVSIIKASGESVTFSEQKYRESLRRSGAPSDVIDQVLDQIKPQLHEGMTTKQLYKKTYTLLQKMELTSVSGRYHLKQAIMNLGPSGFPFEKYIAALLQAQGFSTLVDQEVKGRCIPHEIDVIAIKDTERLMIECKFHSAPGTRCAVQTSLYVKARYEDVKNACDQDRSCMPKYSTCWLVTNTKFSSVAIDYGECVGMSLLGWAYPMNNGLEKIIDMHGLHPITCLSSIPRKISQELLKEGVVFCHDLKNKEFLLRQLGASNDGIKKIIKECEEICQREGIHIKKGRLS